MRRMAYKIKGKNKISKESKNLKIARDKGVNSSDWLADNLIYTIELKKENSAIEYQSLICQQRPKRNQGSILI